MNARIEGGYDHNRKILSEIVPLDSPFSVFISATQKCNFRCFYCTHGQDPSENIQLNKIHLAPDLFQLITQQLKEFPSVGRVLFTGLGEPLVNQSLPDMIQKLREEKISDRIEVISNGSLLSHTMSDRLIEAGLTYLRISLQGLTSEKYKQTAGVNLDFNQLMDNLAYFYHRKGNCKLYIKVMDACLDSESEIDQFYEMFGPISDQMYVEHIVQAQPQMMGKYGDDVTSAKTFFNEPAEHRDVCPFAFYTLQIDAEGNVFPCPPLGLPKSFSLGNVRNSSLYKIWHGEKLYQLQMEHLKSNRCAVAVCKDCYNDPCI